VYVIDPVAVAALVYAGHVSLRRPASVPAAVPGGGQPFHDRRMGYSLRYPAGWAQRDATGPGNGHSDWQVFSSEEEGMQAQVFVEKSPLASCQTGPDGVPIWSDPIHIDHASAVRWTSVSSSPTSYFENIGVVHGGWCYTLYWGSGSRATLEAHQADIDAMIASFRFNR